MKFLKSFIALLLISVLLTASVILICVSAESSETDTSSSDTSSSETSEPVVLPRPIITSGNSVVVYNIDTKMTVFDENSHVVLQPGVIAKLMTAILCYEKTDNLKTEVTITVPMIENTGVSGDIAAPRLESMTPGNKYTVEELFKATLITGANNACNALAYYIYEGDMEAMVADMNSRAAEYGCVNTKFTNAHGLYDDGAKMTAADAALIAAEFYRHPKLLEISSTASYLLGSTLHTKNYLLSDSLMQGFKLKNAVGMAAGQAKGSGEYTLVTSGESDGLSYIYVIMNGRGEIRHNNGTREFQGENAYSDMHKIFRWCLNSFGYTQIIDKDEPVDEIEVTQANTDYVAIVPESKIEILVLLDVDLSLIEKKIYLNEEYLTAPVAKDYEVGRIDIVLDGKIIATKKLVTRNSVDKSEVIATFDGLGAFLFSDTMKTILIILGGVFAAFFVLTFSMFVHRTIQRAKRGGSNDRQKK